MAQVLVLQADRLYANPPHTSLLLLTPERILDADSLDDLAVLEVLGDQGRASGRRPARFK